ncbi:MAG: mevalonate kinase [Prolixibacteraceae bacterium]
MTNLFPSKIILFGEYSLVAGGSGLAVPYTHYSGELSFEAGPNSAISNQSIQQLFDYLRTRIAPNIINLLQLERDLENGLWFDSNIPNGYGLGSSGALIAALYHRYQLEKATDLSTLKSHLASMESFFHGSSSGVDPLVALLQKPVILKQNQVTELCDWSLEKLGFSLYLVDTGLKSKTISLVDWFKFSMLKERFNEATKHDYMLPNEAIITNIQQGLPIDFHHIMEISRYQLEYLSPMVTDTFRKHFFAGLENTNFAFKLCGSGGGGFMLCFARDKKMAETYFKENQLRFEPLI